MEGKGSGSGGFYIIIGIVVAVLVGRFIMDFLGASIYAMLGWGPETVDRFHMAVSNLKAVIRIIGIIIMVGGFLLAAGIIFSVKAGKKADEENRVEQDIRRYNQRMSNTAGNTESRVSKVTHESPAKTSGDKQAVTQNVDEKHMTADNSAESNSVEDSSFSERDVLLEELQRESLEAEKIMDGILEDAGKYK